MRLSFLPPCSGFSTPFLSATKRLPRVTRDTASRPYSQTKNFLQRLSTGTSKIATPLFLTQPTAAFAKQSEWDIMQRQIEHNHGMIPGELDIVITCAILTGVLLVAGLALRNA